MDEQEYLTERLGDQIDWYDKKSKSNQRWFKGFQILVITASASIPFLTGYITETHLYLKDIVGLLGLSIAIISAFSALGKFQENWLEYRTSCESLRHEKYLFLTKTEPYDGDNSFALLVQRVEGLISKENSNWASYMKESEDKK